MTEDWRMKLYILLFSIAISLFSNVAMAAFIYQGKPISPECLAGLINHDDADRHAAVNLTKCSSLKKAQKVNVQHNVFTTRSISGNGDDPYSNYAVIGQYGNKYLIDFGQWTGGSGFFTTIMWVELLGDKLQLLDVYAGGDRCNGGTEKTGPWEYGVNLTSTDLINLAGNKTISINPYQDLDASAAGCVAEAHFSFNPDKATTQFVYVELDKDMDMTISWAKGFTHQVCLNEIFKSYFKNGIYKLDIQAIKKLAAEFKEKCMTSEN